MELINGLPCPHCGRNCHELDERGYCFSTPVVGHEKPGFARVTTTHGQSVLVRVTRETSRAVHDLVSPWRIEVGGQPARSVIDPRDFGLTREAFADLCTRVPA